MDAADLSCPFAPATPDKDGTTRDYQDNEMVQPTREEHTQDIDMAKSEGVTSPEDDIGTHATEREPSEKVSSQESKIQKEDKRDNQEIESNKKQRKKPKRKKHRPKVIQEGKPLKTPKPVTPMPKVSKPSTNREKHGKRSYMKKKKILESTDSTSDVGGETVDPDIITEATSVRCKLNFDVEEQAKHQIPASTLMNAESQPQEAYIGAKSCVQTVQEVQVVARQEGSKQRFYIQKPNHVPKNCARLTKERNLPVQIDIRRLIKAGHYFDPREGDGLNGSSNIPFVKARESMGEKKGCDGDIKFYCPNGAPRNTECVEASADIGQVRACRQLGIHNPFSFLTYKRRTNFGFTFFGGDATFPGHLTMDNGQWKTMKIKLKSCRRRKITKENLNKKSPSEHFGCEDEQESKLYRSSIITHASAAEHKKLNNFHACFTHDNQMTQHFDNLDDPSSTYQALVPFIIKNGMGAYKSQNALVPYEGNGMILPYEKPFIQVKKEDQRPKVDLDHMSNLMWESLKEKGLIDTLKTLEGFRQDNRFKKEGIVEDMELGCFFEDKCSKEECFVKDMELTHGRVDVFINALRPILGDRRFSQWKGSVLDSVVGVFLTQNVSDYLSSSAYMQLASTFPLQSNRSSSKNSEFVAGKKSMSIEPEDHETEKMEGIEGQNTFDWDGLRRQVYSSDHRKKRSEESMDSVDWETVRKADINKIAKAIAERGMQNILAGKIKDFLDRMIRDHGSLDLEWLRDICSDKAKEYLISIKGLGPKSVDCVRLLALNQIAFPVDVNVCRIAVRLGWVPLQPLPDNLSIHGLEEYPLLESVQKYLWPRLCTLDWKKLYELHYHMITFGKVFCTKTKPNCKACPLRAQCRHFASESASARRALPGPEEKQIASLTPIAIECVRNPSMDQFKWLPSVTENKTNSCEPIIEEPGSPTQDDEYFDDIEDFGRVALDDYHDSDEILTINLHLEKLNQNVHNCLQPRQNNLQDDSSPMALIAMPMPKLRNASHLRIEHPAYVLPDNHRLLQEMEGRDVDDPCPYLLAIFAPGETAEPRTCCNNQFNSNPNDNFGGFACNSKREGEAKKVRGTILIPCRTAMRGRFPLNGTYFQINEVFADHETSQNPIDVSGEDLRNLPMRTVYFGSSISTILRGQKAEDIKNCFREGYICVKGFSRTTREPKDLCKQFHPMATLKRVAKAPKRTLAGEAKVS